MSELCWLVTPGGLVAYDDEAKDAHRLMKVGSIVRSDFKKMRNGAFFRKWWALAKLGFDYWAEVCEPMDYKGKPVLPNFNRFRKDLTIMAGFYEPTWNIKGELRVEAESLAWSNMTEARFAELYDATIRALIREVFNGKRMKAWTEDELRHVAGEIERFAA